MIISIWGSPNSGKTTLATKMGIEFDALKKRTLVVYTENLSVDISAVFPDEKDFVSMGQLWQQNVDSTKLLSHCMSFPSRNNVAYLSYRPGENIYSYPEFTKYNIVQVIMQLQELFEYIIFDCSSDLSSNMLSLTALEMADVVYNLCGSNLKSGCFFDSNLFLLSDSKYNVDAYINVLSCTRNYEPLSVYKNKYNNKYELAFDKVIYEQYLTGGLNEMKKCKYQSVVDKMVSKDILISSTGLKYNNKGEDEETEKKKKGLFSFLGGDKKKSKHREEFDDE